MQDLDINKTEAAWSSLAGKSTFRTPQRSTNSSSRYLILIPEGKPDIFARISYTLSARLRRGRQASTGAVTSVAMHAGPFSCEDRYQIAGKNNCQL